MSQMPTQDPESRERNDPIWYAHEESQDDEPLPETSAQARDDLADLDAKKGELGEFVRAVRQLQTAVQQTRGAMESFVQRWEQQNDAMTGRIERLEASLERVESRMIRAEEEEKAADFGARLDTVKTSMDALTARNVDVMRQTMEFTNSSARRWTKELEEYRSLFRDSVFDDIWKDLGEIYIDIIKHLNRKKDPHLTREVEYCALEPIQELLENNGVTLLTSETGQKRSFRRTKSRSQRPTANPELDDCVAESLLPGFARGTLCLIPEVVESYSYQEGYVDESLEAEKLKSTEDDIVPSCEEPIEDVEVQTEGPSHDTRIAEEKQS